MIHLSQFHLPIVTFTSLLDEGEISVPVVTISMKIKRLLTRRNMSTQMLSDLMHWNSSTMYGRLARNFFTDIELVEIAQMLNSKYKNGVFTLNCTGEKI